MWMFDDCLYDCIISVLFVWFMTVMHIIFWLWCMTALRLYCLRYDCNIYIAVWFWYLLYDCIVCIMFTVHIALWLWYVTALSLCIWLSSDCRQIYYVCIVWFHYNCVYDYIMIVLYDCYNYSIWLCYFHTITPVQHFGRSNKTFWT